VSLSEVAQVSAGRSRQKESLAPSPRAPGGLGCPVAHPEGRGAIGIYSEPDDALRIIKSYFEIGKLLPAAVGSGDKDIGTILAEATVEAAKQATLEALTGAVRAKVTIPVRVLKLINDSSTAWAVYNVTRERNRLLVAQEYSAGLLQIR
jgi:hypothetical protein